MGRAQVPSAGPGGGSGRRGGLGGGGRRGGSGGSGGGLGGAGRGALYADAAPKSGKLDHTMPQASTSRQSTNRSSSSDRVMFSLRVGSAGWAGTHRARSG